jgi:hypothetical protein
MQSVVFITSPIVRFWRARLRVDAVSSGGFTLKLMKLTLQGPFQGPERGSSNVLEMPQSRTAHIYERSLIDVFPNLTTFLKIYMALQITSCESERFYTLPIIINRVGGMTEFSSESVEKHITKWLS